MIKRNPYEGGEHSELPLILNVKGTSLALSYPLPDPLPPAGEGESSSRPDLRRDFVRPDADARIVVTQNLLVRVSALREPPCAVLR